MRKGHPIVTAGHLFVGKSHVAILCQTMIVLNRGATLYRLKVFMFGVQGQWNVLPFDKKSKMPLPHPRNGKSCPK